MDLKPDPVKILDIITIVRSPTERDVGPWFYLDARKSPPFIEVRKRFLKLTKFDRWKFRATSEARVQLRAFLLGP